MEIKNVMKYAMRALSYGNTKIDVKKNYKLERKVIRAVNYHYKKPQYDFWDQTVDNGGFKIPVRIFMPEKITKNKILVFFHGGGWVTGNIDSYTKPCHNLSDSTGCILACVDYRLAPEFPFPDGLSDCYKVVKEIFSNIGSVLEASPENIVLIGDSAGGNLAAAVSLLARDRKEFCVRRQILIYPSTYNDHSPSSPFLSVKENGKDYILTSEKICDYMNLYIRNGEDLKSPYLAPLLAEDFSNLPETLIITAQYDPLRDEGEAFGEKLISAGNKCEIHRIEDTIHGFFTLPAKFPKVRECYKIINNFLEKM